MDDFILTRFFREMIACMDSTYYDFAGRFLIVLLYSIQNYSTWLPTLLTKHFTHPSNINVLIPLECGNKLKLLTFLALHGNWTFFQTVVLNDFQDGRFSKNNFTYFREMKTIPKLYSGNSGNFGQATTQANSWRGFRPGFLCKQFQSSSLPRWPRSDHQRSTLFGADGYVFPQTYVNGESLQ